jgi:hypothetical protein
MNNLNKLKCRVWDFGLFTSVAMALSAELNDGGFGTVEYYSPWTDPFPCPNKRYIGRDLPGITRIWEFWDDLDSVDTFVFPDVGDVSEQRELRRQGRAVFGTGGNKKDKDIAELEVDRELFKKTLMRRGLAVPKWKLIKGIDNLRAFAKDNPKFWVKPNVGERGVFETFFIESYEESASKLDQIAHDLGIARNVCEFMTEKPIEGCEPGDDVFVCNGKPYDIGLYGWEHKGDSYLCKVTKMDDMVKSLKKVHEAMMPVYLSCEVNGAMSTEIRVGKNKVPYFSDICSRFGNPPAGVISSIYKNFPQIVQGIAHGEVVEPEFRSKFGAELSVDSAECGNEPTPFEFNSKDWLNIKLRTACKVEGVFQHIPFPRNGSTIVKAVGLGDTQDEAENECLKAAENFKCPHKSYNKNSFEELREMIKEGEKVGLGGSL